MQVRWRLGLLVLVLAAFWSHADGAFFKRGATELPPPIPRQQALLAFRDGVETLLIESTVENDGSDLAWIIPVPSQPTKYEAVEPGMLETLRVQTASYVQDEWDGRAYTSLFLLIILLGILSLVIFPRPYLGRHRPWLILILYVLLLLVIFPVLSRSRKAETLGGTTPHGVEVLNDQRVGNYDLQLVKADEPEALQDWLSAEGFGALPEAATTIVGDYIGEGWLFVAAQLRGDASGAIRPHPIALTFPVEQPVYPMRLTAVAGQPTYVELYVVADKQAEPWNGLLELHVSTTVFANPNRRPIPCVPQKPSPDLESTTAFLVGWGELYHPSASQLLWSRAIMTKLAGTLQPADMANDVQIAWGPHQPFHRNVVTHEVAAAKTKYAALLSFLAAAIVGDSLFWMMKPRQLRRYVLMVVLPAMAASGVAAAVVFNRLPRVAHASTPNEDEMHAWYELLMRWDQFSREVEREHPEAWNDADLLRSLIAEHVRNSGATNVYQNAPIHEEWSIGNYVVLDTPCGVHFTVIDDQWVSLYPEQDYLASVRRVIDEETHLPEVLNAYVIPPQWSAGDREAAIDYVERFRYASAGDGTSQAMYFRFETDQTAWEYLIQARRDVGAVQSMTESEGETLFWEEARGLDPETGEMQTLPWWNDHKDLRYENYSGENAYYKWPADPDNEAQALVSVMALPTEHTRVILYVHVQSPPEAAAEYNSPNGPNRPTSYS